MDHRPNNAKSEFVVHLQKANLFQKLFKDHTPHRKRSPPLKRAFKIKIIKSRPSKSSCKL